MSFISTDGEVHIIVNWDSDSSMEKLLCAVTNFFLLLEEERDLSIIEAVLGIFYLSIFFIFCIQCVVNFFDLF